MRSGFPNSSTKETHITRTFGNPNGNSHTEFVMEQTITYGGDNMNGKQVNIKKTYVNNNDMNFSNNFNDPFSNFDNLNNDNFFSKNNFDNDGFGKFNFSNKQQLSNDNFFNKNNFNNNDDFFGNFKKNDFFNKNNFNNDNAQEDYEDNNFNNSNKGKKSIFDDFEDNSEGNTGGNSYGQGTESNDFLSQFRNECLIVHNQHRKKHHVCDLVANSELDQIAQNYAEKIARSQSFQHSNGKFKNDHMGENLFMQMGRKMTGKYAVDSWYNEIKDYNFNHPEGCSGTGHFTQLVWKGSKQLGIGCAQSSDGSYYVVANYYPAGNWVGNYKNNVLPA